tara:strand:+ start:307 stop:522 length:216 start_codon:yes stop_codon:yes gene_type:complete
MNIIDLHGIRHKDVSCIITNKCIEYEEPFIVITGISHTMKKIVAAIAKTFDLSVRDTIDNPGRIIVYEERK